MSSVLVINMLGPGYVMGKVFTGCLSSSSDYVLHPFSWLVTLRQKEIANFTKLKTKTKKHATFNMTQHVFPGFLQSFWSNSNHLQPIWAEM